MLDLLSQPRVSRCFSFYWFLVWCIFAAVSFFRRWFQFFSFSRLCLFAPVIFCQLFLGLSSFVYRLFELYSKEFKLYIVLTLIVSYFSIKRGNFQVERCLFLNLV